MTNIFLCVNPSGEYSKHVGEYSKHEGEYSSDLETTNNTMYLIPVLHNNTVQPIVPSLFKYYQIDFLEHFISTIHSVSCKFHYFFYLLPNVFKIINLYQSLSA